MTIDFLERVIAKIEGATAIAMLTIMIALAFFQVIARNFFSFGLLWADPFLRHLVLWLGFVGASMATQNEKHITIDVLSRFVSAERVNIIRIITNMFAALLCFSLSSAGWTFLLSEIESDEVIFTIASYDIKTWWLQTVIPYGFGLMTFRFSLKTLKHIFAAFTPNMIPEKK